jgi:uncharacterized protein YjiS (DUF1127 family)
MSKLINSKGAAALSPLAGWSRVRGSLQLHALPSSLMVGARWLVAALSQELAARRAMHSLASLDDRMLRDIGLERGQIDHAVRQGRQAAKRLDDARSDLIRWA